MTIFREKKVFRLIKKKVRYEVIRNPITLTIGENMVISGAFSKTKYILNILNILNTLVIVYYQ